tara:strand:+ start:2427 stop:2840 length:414 start_codon:yes stop_codon:yes gene_type:complete
MGYTIELSININKQHNISSLKEMLLEKAMNYNCENNYWFHEFENNKKKIYRHNLIGCFSFDYNNVVYANSFINYINKLNDVYIECIYEDEIKYKLLYVSSFYLKKMNKEYAKIYKSNAQSIKFSTNELLLLKNFIKL